MHKDVVAKLLSEASTTPNVASASFGLTSREIQEVSKELKKMQDKEKKKEKVLRVDTTTTARN